MSDEQQVAPDPMIEFNALQAVISALQPLSPEAQQRIVDSAVTFLRLSEPRGTSPHRKRVVIRASPRAIGLLPIPPTQQ